MISFRCHYFLKMYIFQPINNSVQDSLIAVDNNDTWRSLFQTPPPVSTCHCYVVYTYVMHLGILSQEPPLSLINLTDKG